VRGVGAGTGDAGVGVLSVSAALRDLALCFLEDFFEESKVRHFKKREAKRKPEKAGFAMGEVVCLNCAHG
jgi:hypothetical protein